MGNYTELKFRAVLKEDTPKEVIELLNRVINEKNLGHDKQIFDTSDVFIPELNHRFFKCDRWYMLFLSTNWDDTMQGGKFYQEKGKWVIDLHTEFKNYDGEIGEFIDWITPYIIGENGKCLGYYQTEVADEPINIYIERGY